MAVIDPGSFTVPANKVAGFLAAFAWGFPALPAESQEDQLHRFVVKRAKELKKEYDLYTARQAASATENAIVEDEELFT